MRTAIFGGTFDPIHSAHLEMARRAADQYRLDRVLFIPAGNPPHKHAEASFEHRYRMVRTGLRGRSALRCLAARGGSGEELLDRHHRTCEGRECQRNGALFFIIGSDAFAEIQTWRRWEDVIRAVEFIVVARPGHEIAGPPGARVHRLDSVELPVSSSDIRDALARERIACGVAARDRGLYSRSPAIRVGLAGGRLNPDAGGVQPPVRYHRDLSVLRHAHDIHDEVASAENGSGGFGWLGQKDLRHAIAAREVEQSFRGILAFKNTGLDAHAAREFQVALNGRAHRLG